MLLYGNGMIYALFKKQAGGVLSGLKTQGELESFYT